MKLAAGMLVGIFYLYITFQAFRHSAAGWESGQADIGFWWAVIASFLGIAALGALIGTWIHTRPERR